MKNGGVKVPTNHALQVQEKMLVWYRRFPTKELHIRFAHQVTTVCFSSLPLVNVFLDLTHI